MDLAIRIRNWGWYQLVKTTENLSDEALDNEFVLPQSFERPRFFHHVKWEGRQPDKRASSEPNLSVFEMMDHSARFQAASEWFRSPLWEFLTRPDLNREHFAAFIQGACERHGWFRATPEERLLGRMAFGTNEIGFERGLTPSYRAMLRHVVALENLDAISVLCALFREAYYDFNLDLANVIRDALFDALHGYSTGLHIGKDLKRCLKLLIEDRIIYNRWISEADMPQIFKSKKLGKKEQIESFVIWYISSKREVRFNTGSAIPIVLDTDRTKWLRRNKSRLISIRDSEPAVDFDAMNQEFVLDLEPQKKIVVRDAKSIGGLRTSIEQGVRRIAKYRQEFEDEAAYMFSRRQRAIAGIRGLDGIPKHDKGRRLPVGHEKVNLRGLPRSYGPERDSSALKSSRRMSDDVKKSLKAIRKQLDIDGSSNVSQAARKETTSRRSRKPSK